MNKDEKTFSKYFGLLPSPNAFDGADRTAETELHLRQRCCC